MYTKGIMGKVTMSLDGNMGKVIDPGDALGTCVKVPVLYTVGLYSPSSYYTQNMNLSNIRKHDL